MRKNPSYTALLRPTRLLISEKSATYTIKWSYTIIWQVRVCTMLCILHHKVSMYIHSNVTLVVEMKDKEFTSHKAKYALQFGTNIFMVGLSLTFKS